ncbi:hypothetical protein V6N13_103323 [Hibiscus sabdariffa]
MVDKGEIEDLWPITLFVDNILQKMHWKGLWFAFARHGNVIDAFIARKLSRGGSRFGFIRFDKRSDALRAIERLNDFTLFGNKISVSFARHNNRTWLGKQVKQGKSNFGEKDPQRQWKLGTNNVKVKPLTKDKSVKVEEGAGESSKHEKTIYKKVVGHVEDEDLWKLRRCLVGTMVSVCSVTSIEERLNTWGLGEIKVQRMGGKSFLISVEDEELFLLMEDLRWSYLKEIFMEVEPWSENLIKSKRVTWIEVTGVPIHCWNQISFNRVAEIWGNIEALGENASHTIDCEKFTIMISTFQSAIIDEVIGFEVGNRVHEDKELVKNSKEVDKRIGPSWAEIVSNKMCEGRFHNVENGLDKENMDQMTNRLMDPCLVEWVNFPIPLNSSSWEANVDKQNNIHLAFGELDELREIPDTLEESRGFFPELITKHRKEKKYSSLKDFQDKALWNAAIKEARKALELGKSLGMQIEGDESEAVPETMKYDGTLGLLHWFGRVHPVMKLVGSCGCYGTLHSLRGGVFNIVHRWLERCGEE